MATSCPNEYYILIKLLNACLYENENSNTNFITFSICLAIVWKIIKTNLKYTN